ncbi:MAG TPA: type II secretion system protein N, partial [Burkholderiales bacterium]|nr:type II secretion system protein N [Burkholderiales bacterium]
KGQLAAGISGWSLNGLHATLPAAQLAVLLPSALGDYGWSGILNTRADTFRCNWGRPICTGHVELAWSDAATAQIPGPPLGDYRLRMTAEGEALRFDLRTERGRLQINGAGEVSAGKVRFNGEASATGEDAARLDAVLRTLGRPGSAPGRYLIEYQENQRVG